MRRYNLFGFCVYGRQVNWLFCLYLLSVWQRKRRQNSTIENSVPSDFDLLQTYSLCGVSHFSGYASVFKFDKCHGIVVVHGNDQLLLFRVVAH